MRKLPCAPGATNAKLQQAFPAEHAGAGDQPVDSVHIRTVPSIMDQEWKQGTDTKELPPSSGKEIPASSQEFCRFLFFKKIQFY